jgi:hypothetical protein
MENSQILLMTNLADSKKEEGDDLYTESRDRLSVQEDLLCDWSD